MSPVSGMFPGFQLVARLVFKLQNPAHGQALFLKLKTSCILE